MESATEIIFNNNNLNYYIESYKCLNKLPSTIVEIQEYLNSCLDVVIQANIDVDNTIDNLNVKLSELNNKNRELIKTKYSDKISNMQSHIQNLLLKVKIDDSSRDMYNVLIILHEASIILFQVEGIISFLSTLQKTSANSSVVDEIVESINTTPTSITSTFVFPPTLLRQFTGKFLEQRKIILQYLEYVLNYTFDLILSGNNSVVHYSTYVNLVLSSYGHATSYSFDQLHAVFHNYITNTVQKNVPREIDLGVGKMLVGLQTPVFSVENYRKHLEGVLEVVIIRVMPVLIGFISTLTERTGMNAVNKEGDDLEISLGEGEDGAERLSMPSHQSLLLSISPLQDRITKHSQPLMQPHLMYLPSSASSFLCHQFPQWTFDAVVSYLTTASSFASLSSAPSLNAHPSQVTFSSLPTRQLRMLKYFMCFINYLVKCLGDASTYKHFLRSTSERSPKGLAPSLSLRTFWNGVDPAMSSSEGRFYDENPDDYYIPYMPHSTLISSVTLGLSTTPTLSAASSLPNVSVFNPPSLNTLNRSQPTQTVSPLQLCLRGWKIETIHGVVTNDVIKKFDAVLKSEPLAYIAGRTESAGGGDKNAFSPHPPSPVTNYGTALFRLVDGLVGPASFLYFSAADFVSLILTALKQIAKMGECALVEGRVAVEKLKEGMKAKKERLKHSLKTMSDAEKINITEMPKEVAVGTGERVGGVDEEIAVWVANRTASTNTLGGFFSVCNPSSGELLLDFIDDVLLFSGYTSNHLVKRLEHATGGPSAFCSSSSSLTKNNPTLVQLPSTFLPPSSLHTSLTNCVRSLSSLHPVSPAAISSDSVVASLPLINHPSESPLYQLLRTLCQCLSLSLSFSALFSESDQVISSEPGKTLYVSPLYSSVQSVSSSLLYDTHPSSFDSIGFISVDGFLSSLSTPFTSSLVSSSSPSSYVTSLFSVLMPFINKESRLESSDSVQQPRALLDLLPSSLSMQVLINTLNEAMNHYHSCLSASLLSLSITQHSIQSLNRERNPDYAHNRKKENSLYIPTSFPLPNSFPSTNMFATSEDSPFLNAPPAPLINETTSSLPFMSSSEPIPMQQYDRSPTASQTVRVPTGSTILRVEVMAVLHQHLSDVYAFAKTLLSLLRRNDTTYGYIVRTTRTEVLAKWEQQKASGADVGAIPVIENIDDEIIGYLFPVFDRIIDLLREFVKSNGFIGEDNT